jgi:hypothetical protein
MEAAGLWLRLDPAVWPTMMHAANVTVLELEQLRRIRKIIRKGHVQRIEQDRIVLDGGEVASKPQDLYIDCTASALGHNVNDLSPVFNPKHIRLQMIRAFQPTFSAALIGYLEAAVPDEREKQRLAQVTPMTDTAKDYLQAMVAGIGNQGAWNAHPKVRSWLRQCRLDAFGKTLSELDADDVDKRTILRRIGASAAPAIENLRKLSDWS